jgi:phosphatidylglycerol lysyltransferase
VAPNLPVSTADHARAQALVAAHGWNATSPQVLAPGYRYWFDPTSTTGACVAYADTGRAWVAAGAPLAPAAELAAVAARFVAAARAARRRACLFATEPRFVDAAATAAAGFRATVIAQQPEWDCAAWPATVSRHRGLREQLRRARAKGVTVRAVPLAALDTEATLRAEIDDVTRGWLAGRGMAPLGFLGALHLHDPHGERLAFVAERAGRVVATASVLAVPARRGWLVEHAPRRADAPNGTTELIVDAIMRAAIADGRDWITLGMAPLAGPVAWPLRAARWLGRPLYSFAGIRAARARLHPARWTPLYLSIPDGQSTVATFVDVLTVFARGSLTRYAASTVRGWLRSNQSRRLPSPTETSRS